MADGGDGFMGRCEIVEPRRRNRQWPAEVKAKIVAVSYQPGARVVDMARKYDLLPHRLSDWRRHARQGRLALPGDLMDTLNGSPGSEAAEPAFVPLSILPEPMDQRNHLPRAVLADRVSDREAWPPVMLFRFHPDRRLRGRKCRPSSALVCESACKSDPLGWVSFRWS